MATRIVDMLCDVVALVKSPANRIPFYVVKGGEKDMDKLLDTVKGICKAIDWDKRDERVLSEADQQRALAAAVTLKGVYGELPKDTQSAISTLLELVSSVEKATKDSEDEEMDSQKTILEILESIQQKVVSTETKIEASEAHLDEVTKGINEKVAEIGTRLDKVEKSTEGSKSKAPEDEPKPDQKTEKSELSWRSAVPDAVIASGIERR